ncbi:MAG: hypothetical protein COB71_10105 [Thiotrichales bacterium]|nr:MAG: hypothetical protein COB71_10105 [Thiotrichales bacterium]
MESDAHSERSSARPWPLRDNLQQQVVAQRRPKCTEYPLYRTAATSVDAIKSLLFIRQRKVTIGIVLSSGF